MVWNFPVPANTFMDPDGDSLTFSAALKNGSPLPSWLTFDANYKVGGAQGKFTATPENAGVFSGGFEIALTASDGVATVTDYFTLGIADESGTPIFVPVYDVPPKVAIFDVVAPAGAGVARVPVGLDKPARQSMCFKLTTVNGANGGNSGSVYTAKTQYLTFQAGQQYLTFDVAILRAMTTNQRVNVTLAGNGANLSTTTQRGTGYIMTQAEADALTTAGTPPMLTSISASASVTLPPVPKAQAGWTKVFDPDLVNDFAASDTGLDGSGNPIWFSKPGGGTGLNSREQVGNSEDGIYADPALSVFTGLKSFPLVDLGGGDMCRALRAERLDGQGGRPGPIASPTVAKTYNYTASMITTRKLFPTVKVGDYVEARFKVAPVLHTWPAFWLLPANPFMWPPEIDVLEAFLSSISADRILATVHWSSANKAFGSYFGYNEIMGGTFDPWGFNTWGVYIGFKWIVFYLNDIPYFMIPNMPVAFHGLQDWYILLNIAVGGVGSGTPNNPQDFPVDFPIRFVRVWRKTA